MNQSNTHIHTNKYTKLSPGFFNHPVSNMFRFQICSGMIKQNHVILLDQKQQFHDQKKKFTV